MFDVRSYVQTTLDTALYPNVKTYWGQKSGDDANEYIVYTLDENYNSDYADDVGLIRAFSVNVMYYYRDDKVMTSAGRAAIKSRENQIATALEAAGFEVVGPIDVGEDESGFSSCVFDCLYQVVV